MKKRTILYRLPILAAILALTVAGCKKEPGAPADYRAKYLGDWDFKVHKVTVNPFTGNTDDSTAYTGTIRYGGGDSLNIRYTANDSLTLVIDQAGKLTRNGCYCFGEFDGDTKLHMTLRWGGNALGEEHTLDATKK